MKLGTSTTHRHLCLFGTLKLGTHRYFKVCKKNQSTVFTEIIVPLNKPFEFNLYQYHKFVSHSVRKIDF